MANSRPAEDKESYIKTQSQYFDNCVEFFTQPVPEVIRERTRNIVERAKLDESSRVLDVGTGTGALIHHFLEIGVQPGNIVGLDVSQEMLREARKRFPELSFFLMDIADASLPLPNQSFDHIRCFDVVFFNGCFGNMWNQMDALEAAARLLCRRGQIVISHPLGARFVDSLHSNEPHIVPHRLPDENELEKLCSETEISVVETDIQDEFYLVVLRKNA